MLWTSISGTAGTSSSFQVFWLFFRLWWMHYNLVPSHHQWFKCNKVLNHSEFCISHNFWHKAIVRPNIRIFAKNNGRMTCVTFRSFTPSSMPEVSRWKITAMPSVACLFSECFACSPIKNHDSVKVWMSLEYLYRMHHQSSQLRSAKS